ncbi:MAG: hypothetical protein ACRDKX_01960 [Solirubrobacterales bacterium]
MEQGTGVVVFPEGERPRSRLRRLVTEGFEQKGREFRELSGDVSHAEESDGAAEVDR